MKKLAVCGKGGSGKSTVVTLFAQGLQKRSYKVLVVDSDESNLGLYRLLGLKTAPAALMDSMGGKKGIKDKLPPKSAVGLAKANTGILDAAHIRLKDIPEPYIGRIDGISMVSIGKIHEAMEGCACPIGALGREFLEKLEVGPGEMVLVDMEAGVEHFGRGVEAGVDAILIVVDPSFESLELAGRIDDIARNMGIATVAAVVNKVTSDDMMDKIRVLLSEKNVDVIGSIRQNSEVFTAGLEGRAVRESTSAADINMILDNLGI